jgi:SAM-dependent methyltransferase
VERAGDDYLLADADFVAERRRLDAQARMLDPATQRCIERTGISPGWQCLEAAAGTGSVARWLAERVGPTGHVLATDVDTRFLEGVDEPNITVVRHDLRTDPLDDEAFDLVHLRLLLISLTDAPRIVERLTRAVRPGGWMVLEETVPEFVPPAAANAFAELQARMLSAAMDVYTANGDRQLGTRLPGLLATLGFSNIDGEAHAPLVRGTTELAHLVLGVTADTLREAIVGTGKVSDEDFEAYHRELENPAAFTYHAAVASVWAQRPTAAPAG